MCHVREHNGVVAERPPVSDHAGTVGPRPRFCTVPRHTLPTLSLPAGVRGRMSVHVLGGWSGLVLARREASERLQSEPVCPVSEPGQHLAGE